MAKNKGRGSSAWQRYLDAAAGLTELTRKQAEQVVRSLVKSGEMAQDRVEKSVDELLKRSQSNRKAIASLVKTETERAISRLGLASQRDIKNLEKQVSRLEATAKAAAPAKSSAAAKRSTAAKPSATKTGAKKSAAAKRSAAKRSAAKSTAAKSGATKSGARKSTAKRSASSGQSGAQGGGEGGGGS